MTTLLTTVLNRIEGALSGEPPRQTPPSVDAASFARDSARIVMDRYTAARKLARDPSLTASQRDALVAITER